MKKLLITGFEPFGGEEINPSAGVLRLLPERIGEYKVETLCLPVVFGEAAEKALAAAERIRPDFLICIGQAGGRAAITPELVGINLRHAEIPDNSGRKPKDEPIIEGGQAAYFSTLPVRKMVEAIRAEGISAGVSYSAGAYVCNDLLYTLLYRFDGRATRVGFIHIPYSEEQVKTPNMPLQDIARGLVAAIKAAVDA